MEQDITAKQQKLLTYLEHCIAETGKAPSLRRSAADMGVSHAAVSQMLKTLESKGLIKREGRYSRTIHLLNRLGRIKGARGLELPVIGRIAAGLPLYAQQEWDGTVVVDADLYQGENLFALRVTGDSMKNAAIIDGDLVVCRPCQYAVDHDIVVALIRFEEATVKRFFLQKDGIELRPDNPAYPSRTYRFDEVLIQGKVIGVLRTEKIMEKR